MSEEIAVDEIIAQPVRVIEGAHIEIEVAPERYSWAFRDRSDQNRINRLWTNAADEMLQHVNNLKGINARIVYQERKNCTACGYGFEMDPETGLTACCGRKVKQ